MKSVTPVTFQVLNRHTRLITTSLATWNRTSPSLPKCSDNATLYPLALCKFLYSECERKKDISTLGRGGNGFGGVFFHSVSLLISYFLNIAETPEASCCLTAKLCPTFCNPMNCSTPGFPVLHYLPEFAQIHVHWVGNAIQPSHSLSSPSPPAFNLSQHQGLFQWVSSSH